MYGSDAGQPAQSLHTKAFVIIRVIVSIASRGFIALHLPRSERAVYCLRLFYKNYIINYNVYLGMFIEKHIPSFVLNGGCVLAIYVPIATYGQRLFIATTCVHCLLKFHIVVTGFYQFTKFQLTFVRFFIYVS